jgi:hypothetical protein
VQSLSLEVTNLNSVLNSSVPLICKPVTNMCNTKLLKVVTSNQIAALLICDCEDNKQLHIRRSLHDYFAVIAVT